MSSLPAAAQGAVKLDKRHTLVQHGARKIELSAEIVRLVRENFQIAGGTAAVPDFGEIGRFSGSRRQRFLVLSKLAVFCVIDQCIGDLAERILDGLLVCEDSLLLLGLGEFQIRSQFSSLEYGLGERRGDVPYCCWAGEQTQQSSARRACGSGQRQIWKELRPRNSDLCVGDDQLLFRLLNVRPPFQQG